MTETDYRKREDARVQALHAVSTVAAYTSTITRLPPAWRWIAATTAVATEMIARAIERGLDSDRVRHLAIDLPAVAIERELDMHPSERPS